MGKIAGSQPRISSLEHAAVALGTNAAVLADTALHQTDDTVVTVFAGQPDVPRNLTVKGNDANVTGDVVIAGTNLENAVITETIALNAANLVAGNKAFKTVTSITLPDWTTANTERVRVGLGAKLGLPAALARNTVLAAFLGTARESTPPTVAFSPTALESNTATLNSALDGSAVAIDFYETL